MFEWLNGMEKQIGNFYGTVVGYNKDTNKLMLEGTEVINGEETNKTIEIDVFTSNIIYNIDYHENWVEKLYDNLKSSKKGIVYILSTEKNSGDNWFFEIYRHKTLLPTDEYGEQIILINYAINFCGDIKGDILTLQEDRSPEGIKEELKKFDDWIWRQIEEVSEFNNSEHWNTFSSIVMSTAFNSNEEIKLAYKLFEEK